MYLAALKSYTILAILHDAFCGLCSVQPTWHQRMAWVAGVSGEYAKDALLDAPGDGGQRLLFAASVACMLLACAFGTPLYAVHSLKALLITACYAMPGKRGIKSLFPLSKTIFVAAVHAWWFLTLHPSAVDVELVFVAQSVISTLFDLKDVDADRASGVSTLATMCGVRGASAVLVVASAAAAARSARLGKGFGVVLFLTAGMAATRNAAVTGSSL